MDNGTMPDVRPFLQPDSDAREHVDGAILLHVASVRDDDLAPIAAQCRTGTDVHILADDDVPGDRGQGVNEGRRVDHGPIAVEGIDHAFLPKDFVQVEDANLIIVLAPAVGVTLAIRKKTVGLELVLSATFGREKQKHDDRSVLSPVQAQGQGVLLSL
jgi:hypothetical protein